MRISGRPSEVATTCAAILTHAEGKVAELKSAEEQGRGSVLHRQDWEKVARSAREAWHDANTVIAVSPCADQLTVEVQIYTVNR